MSARDKIRAIRGNVYGSQGQGEALNVPRASVYRTTALGIPTGTPTLIPWDTVEYDTDGMWRPGTPSALICVTAGVYRYTCWGSYANAGDATFRQFYFTKNGLDQRSEIVLTAFNGFRTSLTNSVEFDMDAGDFVQPVFAHGSATTPLAFGVATAATRLNGFQCCLVSTT